MICAECKKPIHWRGKKGQMFPVTALQFCSERCLKLHVQAQRPLHEKDLLDLGITSAPLEFGTRYCYSPELGVSFRSWFECSLAEWLVSRWRTQIFYEPHCMHIEPNQRYIPDFWLPEFGVWLEVKGEWLGGKAKFEHALQIFGRQRLILIPSLYKSWFGCRSRT